MLKTECLNTENENQMKYLYNLRLIQLPNYSHLKKFFRDLKEAIAGNEQDFTTGKLSRAIFLLSVPMVLEMLLESVFAVVDIFFVSKLGPDAIATVGLTESVITVVYAIAIVLSMATTSMVSRRIGEKNPDAAGVVAVQAILAGILISLVIAIPGGLLAGHILELMGASPVIVREMQGYTAWMLGGNVVIMLLFIINAIFRSAGDAAVSMRVLWVANLLNIVLDPILIFGLGPFDGLGIKGAAIATNIGRGLAVLYQFYLLFYGKKRIRLKLSHIRLDIRVMTQLIRISLGV